MYIFGRMIFVLMCIKYAFVCVCVAQHNTYPPKTHWPLSVTYSFAYCFVGRRKIRMPMKRANKVAHSTKHTRISSRLHIIYDVYSVIFVHWFWYCDRRCFNFMRYFVLSYLFMVATRNFWIIRRVLFRQRTRSHAFIHPCVCDCVEATEEDEEVCQWAANNEFISVELLKSNRRNHI